MPESFAHRFTDLRIVSRSPQGIDGLEPYAVVKLAAVSDYVSQHAPDICITGRSLDDARLRRAHLQFDFGGKGTAPRLQANAVATDCLELLLGYGRRRGDSDHRISNWHSDLTVQFASRGTGEGSDQQQGGGTPTRTKHNYLAKCAQPAPR